MHCYACSLHWWDELAPLLARRHRVVRIDLLGHGGSQKPSSGYEIDEQAALVAGALDQLGVEGAVVVGHSMGFSVATALAQRASQLVDRVVNIGEGPGEDSCSVAVRRQARVRAGDRRGDVAVDAELRDRGRLRIGVRPRLRHLLGLFEPRPGRRRPPRDDLHRFRDAEDAAGDYVESDPLDDRLRQTAVPLLSIFGTEDQICDPEGSQAAYEGVPGARLAEIEGAGHSPNVEKPQETAALIEEFALDAGDEAIPGPPKDVGQRPGRDRGGN